MTTQNFAHQNETSQHNRPERSDLLFRMDLMVNGQKEIHCCSGNISQGGIFILLNKKCQSKLLGQKGLCHIFVGHDYFEMPFEVVRTSEQGVGLHVPKGYSDDFNLFLAHAQGGESTGMGMDAMNDEGFHPGQMGTVTHPGCSSHLM